VNPDFINSRFLGVIARIEGAGSLGQAVKRRDGEIKMAFVNEFRRFAR